MAGALLFESPSTEVENQIQISGITVDQGLAFYAGAIYFSNTISLSNSFLQDGVFTNIFSSRGAVIIDRHFMG